MAHGTRRIEDDGISLPENMPFGKYQNWPLSALRDDPKYVRWLLDNQWIRLGVALSREPWIKEFIRQEEN